MSNFNIVSFFKSSHRAQILSSLKIDSLIFYDLENEIRELRENNVFTIEYIQSRPTVLIDYKDALKYLFEGKINFITQQEIFYSK
jgi:hypothetical protein